MLIVCSPLLRFSHCAISTILFMSSLNIGNVEQLGNVQSRRDLEKSKIFKSELSSSEMVYFCGWKVLV